MRSKSSELNTELIGNILVLRKVTIPKANGLVGISPGFLTR